MATPTWGSYTLEEVTGLVTAYIDLQPIRTRPYVHPRLMDIEVAIRRLPRYLRNVVFLFGVVGLSSRKVGELTGVSHVTVQTRFKVALDRITLGLNGGHPES